MQINEYKYLYGNSEDAAPGWDAIDLSLRQIYDTQQPKHWRSVLKAMLGGPDPIDGISAYQSHSGGAEHLHFVTYGYSELYYNEKAVGKDFSRFGFEMTFRLASPLPPTEDSTWVCNLLQNLARYVFKSGKWFEPYHWIPANGPIRLDHPTDIVGLAFVGDPQLAPIDTPHGRVEFLLAFGLTAQELSDIKEKVRSCEEIVESHRLKNPMLITDLSRRNAPSNESVQHT